MQLYVCCILKKITMQILYALLDFDVDCYVVDAA